MPTVVIKIECDQFDDLEMRSTLTQLLKYTFPENIVHRMPFGGLFTEDFLINTAFSKKI